MKVRFFIFIFCTSCVDVKQTVPEVQSPCVINFILVSLKKCSDKHKPKAKRMKVPILIYCASC